MLKRLLSASFWAFLVLSSIGLFPIAVLIWLLTSPFDQRRRLLHLFTCFWASLYTWLNPAWPVEVLGREKIRRDAAYVMIANHLSLLDILVLFRLFTHFKWVSKIENFRIPFIGWNMRLNRYIELKRGDRESVVRMLEACRRTLGEGNSIMMFPEGTRSSDGRLRRFKEGAFGLALDTKGPILPIVVQGTADALALEEHDAAGVACAGVCVAVRDQAAEPRLAVLVLGDHSGRQPVERRRDHREQE